MAKVKPFDMNRKPNPELWRAELRRVEDVLTTRINLLEAEIKMLRSRLKQAEPPKA